MSSSFFFFFFSLHLSTTELVLAHELEMFFFFFFFFSLHLSTTKRRLLSTVSIPFCLMLFGTILPRNLFAVFLPAFFGGLPKLYSVCYRRFPAVMVLSGHMPHPLQFVFRDTAHDVRYFNSSSDFHVPNLICQTDSKLIMRSIVRSLTTNYSAFLFVIVSDFAL